MVVLPVINRWFVSVEKPKSSRATRICQGGQDISDRGFELLGVRVADFEASHGAIEFLARQVEERS